MSATESVTTSAAIPRRMPRSILVLLGGISGLLLLGIVVALTIGRRSEVRYPAHSPEGTVATYLRLLQDGNLDQAYKLTHMSFDPGIGGPMSRAQFQQALGRWNERTHRVTLVRARHSGREASITVEISAFSSDVFGASDQTSRQTFTLVLLKGDWRITGPSYLYP
ncbi:MAG: hypothetical protein NVS2B16_27460 [Chloroflexota bacterium]